jgi:hypothetical protein
VVSLPYKYYLPHRVLVRAGCRIFVQEMEKLTA